MTYTHWNDYFYIQKKPPKKTTRLFTFSRFASMLISNKQKGQRKQSWTQMAGEWPASTSTMSTITEASLTMLAWPVQRRRSALGVVAMAQKLLVNGGRDRRESHAPTVKLKLNPISLNASEMMCLFALVRGPVYSLIPPAFHSLCRSINISQLPGDNRPSFGWNRGFSEQIKAEIEGQLTVV